MNQSITLTLTVPVKTFIEYQLTASQIYVLDLLLGLDKHLVCHDKQAFTSGTHWKVTAIKYIRMELGISLKEAKDLVEYYYDTLKVSKTFANSL